MMDILPAADQSIGHFNINTDHRSLEAFIPPSLGLEASAMRSSQTDPPFRQTSESSSTINYPWVPPPPLPEQAKKTYQGNPTDIRRSYKAYPQPGFCTQSRLIQSQIWLCSWYSDSVDGKDGSWFCSYPRSNQTNITKTISKVIFTRCPSATRFICHCHSPHPAPPNESCRDLQGVKVAVTHFWRSASTVAPDTPANRSYSKLCTRFLLVRKLLEPGQKFCKKRVWGDKMKGYN